MSVASGVMCPLRPCLSNNTRGVPKDLHGGKKSSRRLRKAITNELFGKPTGYFYYNFSFFCAFAMFFCFFFGDYQCFLYVCQMIGNFVALSSTLSL